MRGKAKILVLCTIVLVFTLTVQVNAGDKRGPRASLKLFTECQLDLDSGPDEAFFVVTATLTNSSSGGIIPEVRGGIIEGTYKPKDVPGNVNFSFDSALISDLILVPADVNPTLPIIAEFPLCDGSGNVIPEINSARELNTKVTVEYGISGGGGESRFAGSRCTGGGIKVDAVIYQMIVDACD